MATWDDVREIAMALPEMEERAPRDGAPQWRVGDKLVAWERPLRRADRDALGGSAPADPPLAAHVPDLGAKEALLAEGDAYFTTPHFDGYPVILVELERIDEADLRELLVEAWLDRAPKRLVKKYLGSAS